MRNFTILTGVAALTLVLSSSAMAGGNSEDFEDVTATPAELSDQAVEGIIAQQELAAARKVQAWKAQHAMSLETIDADLRQLASTEPVQIAQTEEEENGLDLGSCVFGEFLCSIADYNSSVNNTVQTRRDPASFNTVETTVATRDNVFSDTGSKTFRGKKGKKVAKHVGAKIDRQLGKVERKIDATGQYDFEYTVTVDGRKVTVSISIDKLGTRTIVSRVRDGGPQGESEGTAGRSNGMQDREGRYSGREPQRF